MSRLLALAGLVLVLSLSACDEKKVDAPKAPAGGTGSAIPKIDTAAIQQQADALIKDAKEKLEQVKSLVSEKKLDQADELLKKVEPLKDKLPADVQKLVVQARSAIDTARKAVGSVPEMPK